MSVKTWNEFATDLTGYVQQHWPNMHRGAVMMPCIDEGTVFALLFGNNVAPSTETTGRELDLVREQLQRSGIEDLGLGLSDDGQTWALVVRVEVKPYETHLAREFEKEMIKLTLEEAVHDAWWSLYDSTAGVGAKKALATVD
jgi:hypothetical protein